MPQKHRSADNSQVIQNRCTKKWSLAVRARAGHVCERCGMSCTRLQSHHVVSWRCKARGTLRWALQNGVSCCPLCHRLGGESFHSNPPLTMEWFKQTRPDDYQHVLLHYRDSLPEGAEEARAYLKWVESVMDKAIADSACNSTPAVV